MFSRPQDNKLSVSDSHVKVKGLSCLLVWLLVGFWGFFLNLHWG